MSDKVDVKRTLASYRAPKGRFEIIDMPDLQYLMIDGFGDPNGDDYSEALRCLYPVAYKLKFASKRELGRDYVVPPLEGLWWADDMRLFTTARDKSRWHWTMMIMAPEWISPTMVQAAVAAAASAEASSGPAGGRAARTRLFSEVRLEALAEGRCVQTLHIGSYDDESDILHEMHTEFLPSHGLQLTGKHHEIYLSDPRKTAPENLRTILRQPVR
jgi:hypothetical protein